MQMSEKKALFSIKKKRRKSSFCRNLFFKTALGLIVAASFLLIPCGLANAPNENGGYSTSAVAQTLLQGGMQALRARDFNRVRNIAQQALSVDPKNEEIYRLWAAAELMSGDNMEAIRVCKLAENKKVKSSALYLVAAQAYLTIDIGNGSVEVSVFYLLDMADDAWKEEQKNS